MWFKVEHKRSSIRQRFVVRCNSEIAGSPVIEERPAQGIAAARKTAEILASTLTAIMHDVAHFSALLSERALAVRPAGSV
jgi:hypothetical protein